MKLIVNTARIIVGCLFMFSGLVKAIDPLGLSYKMQEFFEVWAASGFMKGTMMWWYEHALWFSITIITIEVMLGFTLLIGWKKNITTWLLMLLTVFFTFLTAFVLFTGKIRACGCFGDCIPLTPVQTFVKDLVLLVLIIIIIAGRKYIRSVFKKEAISIILTIIMLLIVLFIQYYVLKHLPLKDCLPFKKGNNILELRKMPTDAVPDKYDYTFVYEKNGEKKEFKVDALPDSTWQFVDRKQVLVQKGKNNIPLINDFSLKTETGADSTEAILSQPGEYYLLFIKDPALLPAKWEEDQKIILNLKDNGKQVYVVSPQRSILVYRFDALSGKNGKIPVQVFTSDVTAVKTAARNNVTLYRMEGPVVKNKWGGNDIQKAKY